MQKNEMIEILITSIGYDGAGMAKRKDLDLFVPRSLPGNAVRVKIKNIRPHSAEGELVKIIKPSVKRVEPGCSAFENGCGGCQWLHMEYGEQLFWKKKLLTDVLKFQGNYSGGINDIIGMKNPSHCRNKLSLLNKDGRLVFMQENSSKTIFLDRCRQEIEGNQKVYDKMKDFSFPPEILQLHLRSNEDGKTGIHFFVKRFTPDVKRLGGKIMKEIKTVTGIGASSYREYRTIAGKDYLEQKIGNINYHIPLNGFFQTNYSQAGILQKLVEDCLPVRSGNVLDLYCGTGFFSLPAALKSSRVMGIENNPDSVKNAGMNAVLNKIGNVEFIASGSGRILKELKPGFFDTVILDPPREGCEIGVVHELQRLKPKTIVYISCSPKTLANDLKLLAEKAYKVVSCQGVDMFPHTFHIETVIKLERN